MEKFLRSNMFARVLALFMAIALWLFVMGDNITRTTPARKEIQGVPLHVENLENGLVITDMPSSVSVILEGLPAAFEGLTVDELEANVDLAEKGPGTHQLRVRGKPPRGLSLITFSPQQVNITLEALASGEFQVAVDFYGEPAQGWTRKTFSVEPEYVRAEAPRSTFELIDQVVLHIDQSGLSGQTRRRAIPVAVDSQGEELPGVTLIPEEITVTINLERIEDTALTEN